MIVIKRKSEILITFGALLITAGVGLCVYNLQEDAHAATRSENVLMQIQTTPKNNIEPTAGAESAPAVRHASEMETVVVDGYSYIGTISIPVLELELPVMDEWDYTRLQTAPCRAAGSTITDDFVIVAHNYDSHFGHLSDLEQGDSVTFTEVDGFLNTYCVEKREILEPDQEDAVLFSDYDLVLYTCTKGGARRVVVFCNRTEEVENTK